MAETERLSHFDADGLSVIERIENGGFLPWRKIGENLFLASSLDETEVARRIIRGWMRSSAHRKNVKTSSWRLTRIGVIALVTAEPTLARFLPIADSGYEVFRLGLHVL